MTRRVAMLAVHHLRAHGFQAAGGAEKYIRLTVAALLDAGAEVHVGYSGDDIYESLRHRAGGPGLTIERTDWLDENLSGDARLRGRTILTRRRWLRATGADTVFAVQLAGGGAFGCSLAAARSLGLRVVASVRQMPEAAPASLGKRWLGVVPSPELWRRRLIWRKRIPAWCCHAIIYNSRNVANAYEATYGFPRGRARVIYNGETARPCLSPGRPPTRIAAVGRITEAKGADLLLDAFMLIAPEHPAARLTYYGDGPLVMRLRDRAAAMGVGDRVTFAGYRVDPDEIYPDIDICVQVSRRESMSNSVVEAMARGIPCIVSDVGGLPETVENGVSGFVVPSGNADELANALGRMLSDPEATARLAAAAQQRAERMFNLGERMRETVATILGAKVEN